MLKCTITDLSSVDEGLRSLYVQDGALYRLQVDTTDLPELQSLRAAKDKLLGEKKEADRLAMEEAQKAEREHLESLEKQKKWDEVLELTKKTHADTLQQSHAREAELQNKLTTSIKSSAVTKLAAELSGDRAALITPHIEARLSVDENHNLQILGPDGSPSAMTLDLLAAEFRSSDLYAPLIMGRGSSGSGAMGGSGGAPASEHEQYFKPGTVNLTKQMELRATDPDLYETLRKKYPAVAPLQGMVR